MSDLLQFVKESFTIAHVNLRTERHGDEEVGAVDVNMEAAMPNGVLSKFSPTLRDCIYTYDEGSTRDMVDDSFKPHLMNPQMGEIKWDFKIARAKFEVHDDNDLGYFAFCDVKAGKFSFACKEGGTVHVKFQVQISKPTPEEVAMFYQLQAHTVKISLEQQVQKQPEQQAPEEQETTGQPAESSANVLPLFPTQSDASTEEEEESAGEPNGNISTAEDEEALYEKAKDFVAALNAVSISILKREFEIETIVAQRLLERLEEDGLIDEARDNGMHDVKAA